jgi:hypothetical protein
MPRPMFNGRVASPVPANPGWASRSARFGSDIASLLAMGLFVPLAILAVGVPVAFVAGVIIRGAGWVFAAL